MNDIQIATYSAPSWGSRTKGSAHIRKDSEARYYVDNVCVADLRHVGLFTVVTCVDDTTHYVLTAFFKLADRTVERE